jgi:hypothetical protein
LKELLEGTLLDDDLSFSSGGWIPWGGFSLEELLAGALLDVPGLSLSTTLLEDFGLTGSWLLEELLVFSELEELLLTRSELEEISVSGSLELEDTWSW